MQCPLVLEAIILIHNFCTDYVGYSQIKTDFDSKYVWCENLHGYDRIAQYYFWMGDYDSEVDEAVDGANNSDESSNTE